MKISNFLSIMTWRVMFPDDDIKAEMMLPLWNKFIWSLLYFVVVKFDHGKELVRVKSVPQAYYWYCVWKIQISFSLFFGARRKKEDTRKKFQLRLLECWSSLIGYMFLSLLPSVCLCEHPYDSSYKFGLEIWRYTKHGYIIDEEQFLGICIVFQSVYNMMMYSTVF
jgi:hypothetical protein